MSSIWFFTFGLDHPYRDYVQPIIGDYEKAREKMHQMYGFNWCSQRGENEIAFINSGRVISRLDPYKLLPEVESNV